MLGDTETQFTPKLSPISSSGNIPEPPHFTPGQTVGLVLIFLLLLLLLIVLLILLIVCVCRRWRNNRGRDKLKTSMEHTYEAMGLVPQISRSEIMVVPNDAYAVLDPPGSRTSYESIRMGIFESYRNLAITLDENRTPSSLSI